MRAGRRLKAWQKAGHIRRNAEEIIVTTPVTPTVTVAALSIYDPERDREARFRSQARSGEYGAGRECILDCNRRRAAAESAQF